MLLFTAPNSRTLTCGSQRPFQFLPVIELSDDVTAGVLLSHHSLPQPHCWKAFCLPILTVFLKALCHSKRRAVETRCSNAANPLASRKGAGLSNQLSDKTLLSRFIATAQLSRSDAASAA